MSFFTALFYDNVMKYTEEACLIEWRRTLLESVDGNVLEIGRDRRATGIHDQDDKPHLSIRLSNCS